MTLNNLVEMGLYTDETKIVVRSPDMHVLAIGYYYEDCVLKFMNEELGSFVWESEGRLIIDLKCDNDCAKCIDRNELD